MERIRLELSPAAFADGELVGFILHGVDSIDYQTTAYNGGTGIVAAHRGQRLVRQMYDSILPKLKSENVEKCQLEVITKNTPAIRAYEGIGFEKKRELICFSGSVNPVHEDTQLQIREILNPDWKEYRYSGYSKGFLRRNLPTKDHNPRLHQHRRIQ